MTSSRSISSKSRLLVLVAALVLWVGTAHAGRKRVVVLDFEGPHAEKFHKDLVKLLKKDHTVISSDKWNGKAEEMGAGKVTEKNIKKVARKLKVDGVISGKIEKRRGDYIIRLKLRSGSSGEILGRSVQTKAEGPKLDSDARRDIKDELVPKIEELESNRGGGDDDDEGSDDDRRSGFGRERLMDDGDDDDRSSRRKDDDDDRKRDDDRKDDEDRKRNDDDEVADNSDDDGEGRRRKRHRKDADEETASSDDGGSIEESSDDVEEVSTDTELNLSPAHRAVDAVVGLSFTKRSLSFQYASDLGKPPPGYRQKVPVAGAILDVTLYPMAFGHKKGKGLLEGLGIHVLYDQVLKINSRKKYADDMGMPAVADLKTSESRWAVGAVLRYPLGKGPKAIVVGGALTYGKQKFEVQQTLPNDEATDIPNVNYTMISPTVFLQAPLIPKLAFVADASFHAVTDTGAMQTPAQYGASTVTGFEIGGGFDYRLTTNVFVRASVRYESIGFKFKGDPMSMTHTRDTDPEQDVTGAKDSYLGGTATVGYLY